MCRGFTYDTGYTLAPAQPPAGPSYLPASPHHSTTTIRVPTLPHPAAPRKARSEQDRVVSTKMASPLVAHTRVREYQPVIHRLRLAASP
jgi:hypothetical protein